MKVRKIKTISGANLILGKDAESNDELMQKFKGKENVILHTVKPGSPFCVLDKLNPPKEEIKEAGIICASKSQDWRDNKSNVKVHVFGGKQIKKPFFAKPGTWKIIGKAKVIEVKKKDIEKVVKMKKSK